MSVLVLAFVVAAFAENLLLVLAFDRAAMPGIGVPRGLLAANALVIVIIAVFMRPAIRVLVAPPLLDYSAALAFVLTALVVSRSAQSRTDSVGRSRVAGPLVAGLRCSLPVVVADAVTLAFAWWSPPGDAGIARVATFCLVATLGFLVACLLFPALERRLESSNVPSALRGTPIALLTAMLVALAASGLPR